MNTICSANITSVITLCISIFVAYYGYLQFKTHKNRLRLDLYDRRFEIYDIASEASAIVNFCNFNEQKETFFTVQEKLRKAQLEAQFLFAKDKSISTSLMSLLQKISEYTSYHDIDKKSHEAIQKTIDLRYEIGSFANYGGDFFVKIKPYLCFKEI